MIRSTGMLAACASLMFATAANSQGGTPDYAARALEVMKSSFKAKGQAGLDRLERDETQALCSRDPQDLPKEIVDKVLSINQATIRYPADGKLLGDWREGEKIAQSGVGKQYSDDPARPSGGNCYACHRLAARELAFGTIGPPLTQFGKLRGNGVEMQRYAYAKIYNAQAFNACSSMPRFGHSGILSEQQIRDVTALLLDPESPVNK